ncbi:hypothetical protein N7510_008150 [Penicillium lagena]|uniref:uncharacterized protein n=1 Tax=Penicillium lagena TaxID=94218 RepID=UPI0025401DB5|nr:uncharacterized protein N7510_008158 [Penicillium lagena]XP_056833118.1 uncharacterized protein N7510_008150 [Penicillium lagena]KAJ5605377.1 hypothetical protein N7510_008158 [Penicillium lagena]KAJ5611431.1 hypothetical protein N7510_008150 [Penicillium lagena]
MATESRLAGGTWPVLANGQNVNVRVRGEDLTIVVFAAPAEHANSYQPHLPSRPGTFLRREIWDRPAPTTDATMAEYERAEFVDLPAWLSTARNDHVRAIPGLPPPGPQTISSRELRWIFEPVVRDVLFRGLDNYQQLQIRAQLREAILVTRAGRVPPRGQQCSECRNRNAHRPFTHCVSGGFGEKCNNCLYRGHARCSFASWVA